MGDLVSYELNDGVATISMDDGKANALSHAMFDELAAAFDQADKDGAVVVLKGREGRFSGGFDLKEMYKGPDEAKALTKRGSEFAVRLMSFNTPVIGISTGHCIAMGAYTMLACDYRIGAAGDFKIGLNETQIGMPMHRFGIELGRYKIPKNYYNRCLINGEIFGPDEAISAGYYDKIVPVEQLDAAASMAGKMFAQLKMNAFSYTKNASRKELFVLFEECIADDLKMGLDL
jgi:enoyl-CoA hydratase